MWVYWRVLLMLLGSLLRLSVRTVWHAVFVWLDWLVTKSAPVPVRIYVTDSGVSKIGVKSPLQIGIEYTVTFIL